MTCLGNEFGCKTKSRMKTPIYLDNHATTKPDPSVFEAMKPFFLEHFGNASSRHEFGWAASKAVDDSRLAVAQLLGALPKEIIFTSGATEANNIALRGIITSDKNHIITSNAEHKSILEVLADMKVSGRAEYTILDVDRTGQVSPEQVANAITSRTILVSLIYGNNEIGTLNPLSEIGKITRQKKIFLHTDATQAVGHVPVNVNEMSIDLLSLSAHKFHGPKGVGALYVRSQNPRVKIAPHSKGGSQEMGVRPGTLNVPGIIGLGKACEILLQNLNDERARLKQLRDELQLTLLTALPDTKVNGHPTERLPHNLSVTFQGVTSQSILGQMHRSVALSTGSACSTQTSEVSHVLKAIGLSEEAARSTLRFGLGRFTTRDDILQASSIVIDAIRKIRQTSET
jgi:cysteine desulfurase